MSAFEYRDRQLHAEAVPLSTIAERRQCGALSGMAIPAEAQLSPNRTNLPPKICGTILIKI